jgi:hypothetical protein
MTEADGSIIYGLIVVGIMEEKDIDKSTHE